MRKNKTTINIYKIILTGEKKEVGCAFFVLVMLFILDKQIYHQRIVVNLDAID